MTTHCPKCLEHDSRCRCQGNTGALWPSGNRKSDGKMVEHAVAFVFIVFIVWAVYALSIIGARLTVWTASLQIWPFGW